MKKEELSIGLEKIFITKEIPYKETIDDCSRLCI